MSRYLSFLIMSSFLVPRFAAADPGIINLEVLDEALVYIDGVKTMQKGPQRRYSFDAKSPGEYGIRVVIVVDGKKKQQKKTLNVQPGKTYSLAFSQAPTDPAWEPFSNLPKDATEIPKGTVFKLTDAVYLQARTEETVVGSTRNVVPFRRSVATIIHDQSAELRELPRGTEFLILSVKPGNGELLVQTKGGNKFRILCFENAPDRGNARKKKNDDIPPKYSPTKLLASYKTVSFFFEIGHYDESGKFVDGLPEPVIIK